MNIFRLYAATFILFSVPLLFNAVSVDAQAAEPEQGQAAYYADSLEGEKTASGEPYSKKAYTAAHRTLPFGTKVKVTYLKTGKSVEVVINDRGPRAKHRIIDVSRAAAVSLGMIEDGHGEVKLEVIDR